MIQGNGLQINSENNLTLNGDWSFQIYGCRPIFLATSLETMYADHAPIIFEVDIQELTLVADLPALVDSGAYYDIDDGSMWFKHGPELLFRDLLDPDTKECQAAIRKTKTAAYLTNIGPDRLTLIDAATITKRKK